MINKALLFESAQKIGVTLDDTALERFDKYAGILIETNKTLNLTSITEPDEIVHKHFVDCLSVLNEVEFKNGAAAADVGTGAGFPGVVLLIARPDLKMTLMDSTKKRLAFVESVLSELSLSAQVVHIRAEEAGQQKEYREQFDIVTARAVANLNVLSEYCIPLLKKGGVFAAMKGAKAADELDRAKEAIRILGGRALCANEFNIENCGERTIICIKKISQTPPKYPRASAQISKKPLE